MPALALKLVSTAVGMAGGLASASDEMAEALKLSSGESIEAALYELASLNKARESENSDWAS